MSKDTVIIFQCEAVDKIAVSIWKANKNIDDIFNELLKLSTYYNVENILYEIIKNNACHLILTNFDYLRKNTDQKDLILFNSYPLRNFVKRKGVEVCIDFIKPE